MEEKSVWTSPYIRAAIGRLTGIEGVKWADEFSTLAPPTDPKWYGRNAHPLITTFYEGRKRGIITRLGGDVDDRGIIAFPSRRGIQPKAGEMWIVRPCCRTRSGRAVILNLLAPVPSEEAIREEIARIEAEEAKERQRRYDEELRALLAEFGGTTDWDTFAAEFAAHADCGVRLERELKPYGWVVTLHFPQGGWGKLYGYTPRQYHRRDCPADGDGCGEWVLENERRRLALIEELERAYKGGALAARIVCESVRRRIV